MRFISELSYTKYIPPPSGCHISYTGSPPLLYLSKIDGVLQTRLLLQLHTIPALVAQHHTCYIQTLKNSLSLSVLSVLLSVFSLFIIY